MPIFNNFTYYKFNNTIIIDNYTGTETAIKIPARIENLPVKTLADSAFASKNLSEVTYESIHPLKL